MRAAPIAVLALSLASSPAHAGGIGTSEIGLRETAMGAVIGRPDDASAIFHDPAGLVLSPGWRVYASASIVLPRTELGLAPWAQSDRFLGTTPQADGYYAPIAPSRALAAVPMIAVIGELVPGRLYAGLAIFVGNATGAAFPADSVARYHLIDGYLIAPQAMAAAAYRVRDDLAIGVSLGAMNVEVHGHRELFPVIAGYDVSSIIGSDADLRIDGGARAPAWTIGAFGRPHPRVTWGAALVGRIDATLVGPIDITYGRDAENPGDTLIGRQKTSFMLPWSAAAGANVDVSPHVELGVESRRATDCTANTRTSTATSRACSSCARSTRRRTSTTRGSCAAACACTISTRRRASS